jgi:inosose dehydratase
MTDSKPPSPRPSDDLLERLAGAPISWGVCEVPGWGRQLPARRVLAEMRSLGLHATEAGAEGYLPADDAELEALLAEFELRLVGGFVPVVLHDSGSRAATLARVDRAAARFGRCGGSVLVSAVVLDEAWSPRVPLAEEDWRRIFDGFRRLDEICGAHEVAHVVHPHVGTLIETREDVVKVVEDSDVRLCLDTGHLAIGGFDSEALACEAPGRVAHVHLKDVREDIAAELRAGRTSLRDATQRGLFAPLGDGDAPVGAVVRALAGAGYDGWYVLEQDAVVGPGAAGGADAPTRDARRSIGYLRGMRSGAGAAAERAGRR